MIGWWYSCHWQRWQQKHTFHINKKNQKVADSTSKGELIFSWIQTFLFVNFESQKMELELNRIDYCSVGATLPNCMKLLPGFRSKEPQRVCRFWCILLWKSTYFVLEYSNGYWKWIKMYFSGGCWWSRWDRTTFFDEKRRANNSLQNVARRKSAVNSSRRRTRYSLFHRISVLISNFTYFSNGLVNFKVDSLIKYLLLRTIKWKRSTKKEKSS